MLLLPVEAFYHNKMELPKGLRIERDGLGRIRTADLLHRQAWLALKALRQGDVICGLSIKTKISKILIFADNH